MTAQMTSTQCIVHYGKTPFSCLGRLFAAHVCYILFDLQKNKKRVLVGGNF